VPILHRVSSFLNITPLFRSYIAQEGHRLEMMGGAEAEAEARAGVGAQEVDVAAEAMEEAEAETGTAGVGGAAGADRLVRKGTDRSRNRQSCRCLLVKAVCLVSRPAPGPQAQAAVLTTG
jgi:hypothetical protein